MQTNNCPKCDSGNFEISNTIEFFDIIHIKIKCDNCLHQISGINRHKLINEWNKKMYKCPVCNIPLNESMFCVKCCCKWTIKPLEEELKKDNFIAWGNYETIEEAEIEWSDIDSITNLPKTSEQLADEHWGYIEALLKAHEEEYNIKQIEFHYKSAFIHGYKHAMEDK